MTSSLFTVVQTFLPEPCTFIIWLIISQVWIRHAGFDLIFPTEVFLIDTLPLAVQLTLI